MNDLLSQKAGQPDSSTDEAPASSALVAAPERKPAAPAPAGNSVLVVDDYETYRTTLSDVLADAGYTVTTAANGVAGLAEACESHPDLIILDFNMPGLNGFEVIKDLRSREDTRSIPIIMLTGEVNTDRMGDANLDIEELLHKPVCSADLLSVVKRILPSAATQSAEAAGRPARLPADADLKDLIEQQPMPLASLLDLESEPVEEEIGLELAANDSPIVARINSILVHAVERRASDIHIEPREGSLQVRLRVQGILEPLCRLPLTMQSRLAARVKIMAELSITERRHPQDGQFRAAIGGRKIEFRVSTVPSAYGEKLVIRVLGAAKLGQDLVELGWNERDLLCVRRALSSQHGMVLATGPTGSGKTTTLYTMLSSISRPETNIMTAEDPIEYRLPDITQVHVKPAIGFTFEKALRAFLRQDPDVMLVGEIRDLETAEIAAKASLTGHLVLSTLHTNSAPATAARLTHMGLPPYLVSGSLRLVVAQRLIRVLCPKCKAPSAPTAEERKLFSKQQSKRLARVWRKVGCQECGRTGYVGRRSLFEVMPVQTAEMRRLILKGADSEALAVQAVAEGMTTLSEAALACLESGETSLDEGLRILLSE